MYGLVSHVQIYLQQTSLGSTHKVSSWGKLRSEYCNPQWLAAFSRTGSIGSAGLMRIHLYPWPLVGSSMYQWFLNLSINVDDKWDENSSTFSIGMLSFNFIRRVTKTTAAAISSLIAVFWVCADNNAEHGN